MDFKKQELETAVGRLQAIESVTKRVQESADMTSLKQAMLDLCELVHSEMRSAFPDNI